MFRLLVLLGAAMGLALLIGGRDMGQQRAGLQPRPEPAPRRVLPMAAPPAEIAPSASASAAPAPAEPPVTLTGLAERTAPAIPAVPAFAAALAVEEPAADTPAPALPLRWVSAQAINVRGGPSTNDPVIGRLTRNEAVAVVGEAGDGWLRIRIEGDGVEGFVAGRLLTDRPPG